MSAAEAWPRRPPGTRTRPDRSPTLTGDSSSAGGDSAFPSPALGTSSPSLAAGASAFGPRLNLPGPSSVQAEEHKGVKYRHEGTRLDPVRLRGIASAFGMAISLPPAKTPAAAAAASSPSPVSHPSSLSLIPPTSASTHSRGGTSSTSSASSSVSSYPLASPFATASSLDAPVTASGPTRSTTSGHLLSVQAPPYLSPSPVLLPLLPSLKAQIAAIAREFSLPSTVGLVLFIVYENGAGEGRLGEGVWEILWRDFVHGNQMPIASAGLTNSTSDDGRPLDPSSSPSPSPTTSQAPLQRSRYGSEPPMPVSQPGAGPSVTRYPTSQPRQIEPSESLLSRTPSTLTPASLRARKKLARLSAEGGQTRSSGSKSTPKRSSKATLMLADDAARSSLSKEGLGREDDVAPTPSSPRTSPLSRQIRRVGQRVPSSPFPASSSYFAASPIKAYHRRPAGQMGPSTGRAISIVGTLEWDVDERGSSQWYDRWLTRKAVARVPRPAGGWQAAATAAAALAAVTSSAAVHSSREVASDSEDEAPLAADNAYAPLSEGEDDHSPSPRRRGRPLGQGTDIDGSSADDGDEENDSSPSDYDQPAKEDPLSDVFPTDEADFSALRSARDNLLAANDRNVARPTTPPPPSRPREGSVGLGLGIGLEFGLDSVEQRRQRDLDGLRLTGAELGSDEFDEAEPEQGIQEIEDLLVHRTPTPLQPPPIEEPPRDPSTAEGLRGKDDLPPTPLKQRRKSSAKDTSNGSATAGNGNPLNLTLAITSPTPSAQFPTLVTSPSSALSPTGSDATGGLAYLRGGGSIDSYASSGASDGMLSAALEGAFGSGGIGKRGSALLMQDTLANLEKVVRSLSPRELKIPKRERSLALSPGASSLSPAPSGSSFAMFPSPAFPPSAYASPIASPSFATSGSSPRVTPLKGPAIGEGPSRLQPQTIGISEGSTEAQSIASSFKEQQSAHEKQPPLSISTANVAPSVWPSIPVSPGSPLLSDVALPVRKDSPFSSPRVPSPDPGRFDIRPRLSSTSSVTSGQALGSPLTSLASGSGQSPTSPFPPPPTASPLQAAFPTDDEYVDEPQRTERIESTSTTKSSGSRFRTFGWGRATSTGSLEEGAMANPTPTPPALGREVNGGPSSAAVPRHQSIPEPLGPPPLRNATTPAGRSVSDSSAFEALSQFGKLTPDMSSTGFQEMNFPSPPMGSVDRKSASGGKKRFRGQVNLGGLFGGKNKKQLEITPPEIGGPVLQSSPRYATVPFHHRQRSDSSDLPTSPRLPLSPRKGSEPGPGASRGLPPSISQSFSTRSISSTVLSPPGSPTSAMSPRSVKRKPVPGSAMGPQRDLQRSFSQDSSLSIVPSLPDAEPPLPLRTTSLGAPSTPVTPTAPVNGASP